MNDSRTPLLPAVGLAALGLILAACSSGGDTSTAAASTTEAADVATTATQAHPETTESGSEPSSTQAGQGRADAALVSTAPAATPISADDVATLKSLFDDEAYSGGQQAPRLVKWITPNSYLFVQFDAFDPAEGSVPRFLGLGVKGVFCSEAQPDAEGGSFTHFHRPDGAEYADSHGGEPGTQGYWLSFMALDSFEAQERQIIPGIDYELAPTPPPDCGDDVPEVDLEAPGQTTLSADDLAAIIAFFDTDLLAGGQRAPRLYKSITEDVSIFIQLDAFDPAEATTIRYVGLSERGVFCESARSSADFTHYHRHDAAEYADGHGGAPGESNGFWLEFVSVDEFELLFPGQDPSQARHVSPGIDREFAVVEAPPC